MKNHLIINVVRVGDQERASKINLKIREGKKEFNEMRSSIVKILSSLPLLLMKNKFDCLSAMCILIV
jgi:hypothetical protein